MGAPCRIRRSILRSFRSPLATIFTPLRPASSRIRRTRRLSFRRFPLSRRTAFSLRPISAAHLAPRTVSYVSISRIVESGKTSRYLRNASRSLSKAMIQECACVPTLGIPSACPASTLEVAKQPPTYAARAASRPACGPCARRVPKSATGRPQAASTIREAFVATVV